MGGKLAVHQLVVAVRVGHRRAVNLRRKRPETVFVRHALCGKGHREVRPAVVGVIKRDNCLLLGVGPSDLDRVFDRFRAGVEQHAAFLIVARGELVELLGNSDVTLVRSDHEAGVGEQLHLISDGCHYARRTVSDRGHSNPRAEVDQAIAVDIDDHTAASFDSEDRHGRPDASRHRTQSSAPSIPASAARESRFSGCDVAPVRPWRHSPPSKSLPQRLTSGFRNDCLRVQGSAMSIGSVVDRPLGRGRAPMASG